MYELLKCIAFEFFVLFHVKEPSFHVSIAWAPGDISSDVTEEHKTKMAAALEETFEIYDVISAIQVNELKIKTGNRITLLPLG